MSNEPAFWQSAEFVDVMARAMFKLNVLGATAEHLEPDRKPGSDAIAAGLVLIGWALR